MYIWDELDILTCCAQAPCDGRVNGVLSTGFTRVPSAATGPTTVSATNLNTGFKLGVGGLYTYSNSYQ